MNPELIAQYDAAAQALDGFAEVADEDSSSIDARLAQDVADSRLRGSRAWFPRWVLGPLGALRVFEELHQHTVAALAEVRLEVGRLEEEIARLRGEGNFGEAEPFARRRVELLRHQASLSARLDGRRGEQLAAARSGIARVLKVSLRFTAEEAAGLASETLGEAAARVQRVLGQIENYDRLARAAREISSTLTLPVFRAEDVARVRHAATLNAVRLEGSSEPARPAPASAYGLPARVARPLVAAQGLRSAQ